MARGSEYIGGYTQDPDGRAARSRLRNELCPARQIELVPIEKLRPAPRRVRRATRKQCENVVRSIKNFGCVRLVLVRASGEIIDGHIIVEALRELGAGVVPCIVNDYLSETEIRQLTIALNRIQETGYWAEDALRVEFQELLELEVELEVTGFEIPEIDLILQDVSIIPEEIDPLDDLGSLADEKTDVVTRPGDIWIAGNHRIVCGRAQALPDLSAILGRSQVGMVITDPPFNVRISGHVGTVRAMGLVAGGAAA